ncbi:MAG TPA: universal stress protein [Amaricoccus sp.]|uniref:universal stress protein n=1 Tax=Amaricoccus sp. TaxID=1872485 RepID=UPI002CF2852C|nr:universal stress protein [Amaricoccus sp.]HRO12980.1 universal stress protein [Amaricoccus sp.]
MFQHILLPTEGSALATSAVARGIELAAKFGAKITVLTIIERFHVMTLDATELANSLTDYNRHAAEHAARVLGEVEAKAKAAGVEIASVVRTGESPWEEIDKVAVEVGADLIAMAPHGRRGPAGLMLGSQTAQVVARSKVSVLVLR